jgi:hypothetical protein
MSQHQVLPGKNTELANHVSRNESRRGYISFSPNATLIASPCRLSAECEGVCLCYPSAKAYQVGCVKRQCSKHYLVLGKSKKRQLSCLLMNITLFLFLALASVIRGQTLIRHRGTLSPHHTSINSFLLPTVSIISASIPPRRRIGKTLYRINDGRTQGPDHDERRGPRSHRYADQQVALASRKVDKIHRDCRPLCCF